MGAAEAFDVSAAAVSPLKESGLKRDAYSIHKMMSDSSENATYAFTLDDDVQIKGDILLKLMNSVGFYSYFA